MKGETREANEGAAEAYQQSKKTSGANRKAENSISRVCNMLNSKDPSPTQILTVKTLLVYSHLSRYLSFSWAVQRY